MKSCSRLVMIILLLCICCWSSGCGLVENNRLKSWQEWIKMPVEDAKEVLSTESKTRGEVRLEDLTRERITVDLYFARKDGSGLHVEKRDIPKEAAIARRTIEALLKGPENPNLEACLPEGTRLLDINIKPDGLCIVDFSREITTIPPGRARELAIESIVKTLSQFPTVTSVKLLVEGEAGM